MERKTTQRIIGILVVAALVVILLPLVFNNTTTESPKQTAEVKAPPFPDQSPQTVPETVSQQTPVPTEHAPNQNQQATLEAPQNPANPPNLTTTTNVTPDQQPQKDNELLNVPTAVVSPADALAPATSTQDTAAAPEKPTEIIVPAPAVKEPSIQPKKSLHTQKVQHVKPIKPQLTQRDLVKLKNSAWVIQMGSFKNKTNAVRLTNRLRSQGYKAFTREVRSTLRVYVGPEFKQASATSLADKIHQQLNMQGIIVSYNPLEI